MADPWRRVPLPRPLLAAFLGVLLVCVLFAGCGPFGASAPATPTAGTGGGVDGTPGAGTPANTLTYTALGASDGIGIGTIDPRDDNWPSVLAGDLGQTLPAGDSVHLVNLGIPGATLAVAAKMELPVALGAHPNLVTVWLAVNDFAGNVPQDTYADQLRSLLAALRTETHAQVFVADLPDLTLLPYFAGQDPTTLRARVAAWNVETADVVAAAGVRLVDLFAGWRALAQHPEYVSFDGLHPSTAGAAALAGVFAAAIHASSALAALTASNTLASAAVHPAFLPLRPLSVLSASCANSASSANSATSAVPNSGVLPLCAPSAPSGGPRFCILIVDLSGFPLPRVGTTG
jgi:lysophospholipase L1-like esterase